MKKSLAIQNIQEILTKAQAQLNISPNDAIQFANQCYKLSMDTSFLSGMIHSKIILVKANIYLGELVDSTLLCNEIIKTLENKSGYEYEYAETQLCLANIYFYKNETKLALKHIRYNTEANNTSIDLSLKAKSLSLEGNIQSKLNNYSEAFYSFKQSLNIKKSIHFEDLSIAKSLINLATVYVQIDDLSKALKYTEESSKYLENNSGQAKCSYYINYGYILGRQGYLVQGIEKLELAIDLCKKNKLFNLLASTYTNLGEFNYLIGNLEKSLTYANEGLSICKQYNFKNQIYLACITTIFRSYHSNDSLENAAQIGLESVELCKKTTDHKLATELLKELVIVLEKLGRINESLFISKEITKLQSFFYKKKREFDIFQIQSKLEIEMKEQELALQKELYDQQEKHNEELKKINAELDKFVGIASHDLKEPIRTINSFSKVLSKYISEDQREYEYLHYIHEASNRMGNLVEDLLAFARAGKSTTPTKTIYINDIMYFVEQNLRSTIEETQTTLDYDDLPALIAHRTPILQLFQNIIANSIKYSKDNTPPIIKITYQKNATKTTILLEDNGLGIDETRLKSIFDPFTRLYRKTDKKGSGIGLATCKRIAERYQGEIWATSKINKGTRIHISFPNKNIK